MLNKGIMVNSFAVIKFSPLLPPPAAYERKLLAFSGFVFVIKKTCKTSAGYGLHIIYWRNEPAATGGGKGEEIYMFELFIF
jgi:hypothetical protein